MSDWKQDAAKRRDARHGGPVEKSSGPGRRNKRRWCKGKVGVEHKPECRDYQATKRVWGGTTALNGWKVLVCTVCGKELEIWLPLWGEQREKPEWVK